MKHVKGWDEEEDDYALFTSQSNKKKPKKAFKGHCGYCGEFGHKAVDCPMTEFRQPLQVQSHLEMPGILVQLGHIQCT